MTNSVADAGSKVRELLETFISKTLADSSSSFGYAVTSVSIDESIEITLGKGQATFVLWLRPVADEGPCYRSTARFKIGYQRNPPDRLGYALLDAACAQIEVWERSLPDGAHTDLFDPQSASLEQTNSEGVLLPEPALEWLAVLTGLKPASRHVVRPDVIARWREQARAYGLHMQSLEATSFVSGFRGAAGKGKTTLVHVGRTASAAVAAAAAERSMIDATGKAEPYVRALGNALGYPPCCIDAFLAIRRRENSEMRFNALRRTRGLASRLLNDTDEKRCLVSHLVCRYDCPPSVRYARALLDELVRVNPAAADGFERGLDGLVVMFREGGALRLVLGERPAAPLYQFAAVRAYARGAGTRFEAWRAALLNGDALHVVGDDVRILSGASEICQFNAPPDEVQIRLFA
jgi:hypothetical protein